MVLRVVERREVIPVGLDFRTVGDVEADGAENLLDALPGAADRVQAAAAAAAAGQRDIQRLLGEARFQLRQRELPAALFQRRFQALLGRVDVLAEGPAFLGRQGTQRLQQRRQFSRLAEKLRLGVLERRRVSGGGELREGATNYFF